MHDRSNPFVPSQLVVCPSRLVAVCAAVRHRMPRWWSCGQMQGITLALPAIVAAKSRSLGLVPW